MLLLLGWLTAPAFPCAGLVHSTESLAESDAAEAVLSLEGGQTVVEYLVRYQGDAADFGWVVPIPDALVSVEDGDPDWFGRLRGASQPQVETRSVDSGSPESKGCGRAKSGSDGEANLAGGRGGDTGLDVVVVGEGFTGTYAWTEVQADQSEAMELWLEEHDWSLGDSGADLAAYVDEGFHLMLITIEADPAGSDQLLPPLRLTHRGEHLRFPSRMARHGAPEQRTTLYLVGDLRARAAQGWDAVVLDTIETGGDPAQAWEQALRAHTGDQARFVRTYAGHPFDDARFLTRFDTAAADTAHQADAVFAMDEPAEGSVVRIVQTEGGSGGAWLLAPLMGLGWARRRLR